MSATWIPALALTALATTAPITSAAAKSPPAPRCEQIVARTIAFTKAGARDVLEVSAAGVDCAKSVVTVSIRLANGLPVAAFAMPFAALHDEIDPGKPMSRAALGRYLSAYAAEAQLDLAGSTLPAWQAGQPTPGFEQGLELTSPLSREQYQALRAAKPNLLCLRDVHETFACYVWDGKQNSAEVILRR